MSIPIITNIDASALSPSELFALALSTNNDDYLASADKIWADAVRSPRSEKYLDILTLAIGLGYQPAADHISYPNVIDTGTIVLALLQAPLLERNFTFYVDLIKRNRPHTDTFEDFRYRLIEYALIHKWEKVRNYPGIIEVVCDLYEPGNDFLRTIIVERLNAGESVPERFAKFPEFNDYYKHKSIVWPIVYGNIELVERILKK